VPRYGLSQVLMARGCQWVPRYGLSQVPMARGCRWVLAALGRQGRWRRVGVVGAHSAWGVGDAWWLTARGGCGRAWAARGGCGWAPAGCVCVWEGGLWVDRLWRPRHL
jgi:hypothetical protein